MPNEFETAIAETENSETEHQVLTPYNGRETVDRMMTGMMQEMRQGAERAGRRRIQGTVDTFRFMGYEDEAIIDELTASYGISREEAQSFLQS